MSMEEELRTNTVAMDALTQSIDALILLLQKQPMAPEVTVDTTAAVQQEAEKPAGIEADKEPEKEATPTTQKPKKEKPKAEIENLEKVDRSEMESETSHKNPDHTQKELKDLLNEYKEKYGLPMAKKLLPKLTDNKYKTSADVPADEIDGIFDRVYEVINGSDDL